MTSLYDQVHDLFNSKRRFYFPFDDDIEQIPENGIYIIFEKGEKYKQWDRIVRVGTHTGQNQLRSRLKQHFIKENKNRSIFRKNIGRCLLNNVNNDYLIIWELDTTSRVNKQKYGHLINRTFEQKIEKEISRYIQRNLSFTVFEVENKEERLILESRIISTLASFPGIHSSEKWLGQYSTKEKIRKYGLWQVNELLNKPLDNNEYHKLKEIIE
ncbi:MAG: hypothetical protein K9J25_11315 [Bacteroidales bacterium]|nr:hypothetical protein [Bacteroidales bacterium]